MKLNSFLLFALGILLTACDDTLTNIGSSIRPDGDDLTVKSAIFDVNSSTFLADSIYIRTSSPLLGEINDNLYGTIRSDYASEFYGKGFTLDVYNDDTLTFQLGRPGDSLLYNRFDSAVLNIMYTGYVGDSLTPMAATVYELSQPLPTSTSAFYSNVDFSPYIYPLKEIGSAGYTGKDLTVTDSVRNLSTYVPTVRVMLDDEVTQRFMTALLKTPEVYNSQSSFEKLFPGVYVKNTFGNGTILKVGLTRIYFYYRTYHTTLSTTGADSSYTVNRATYIQVSPDVVQLNSVQNPIQPGGNPELMNNDSATFITSPGGYFTQLKLPIGSIMKTLEDNSEASTHYLNGVNLNIQAYKPTNIFSQKPPTYMLLVEKDKMNQFFEQNKLPDSKTSFMATFSNDSTNNVYTYNFGNINSMILTLAEEMKTSKGVKQLSEQDSITLAVVPVQTETNTDYNYLYRVSNYFLPGGIALKSGKNTQKTTMVYTLKVNK